MSYEQSQDEIRPVDPDQVEAWTESVREELRELIRLRRLSQREVEMRCGWTRGYLSQVLQGRITLSLSHVLAVAVAVGETPATFFRDVFPVDEPLPLDELRNRLEAYDAAFDELRSKGLLSGDQGR